MAGESRSPVCLSTHPPSTNISLFGLPLSFLQTSPSLTPLAPPLRPSNHLKYTRGKRAVCLTHFRPPAPGTSSIGPLSSFRHLTTRFLFPALDITSVCLISNGQRDGSDKRPTHNGYPSSRRRVAHSLVQEVPHAFPMLLGAVNPKLRSFPEEASCRRTASHRVNAGWKGLPDHSRFRSVRHRNHPQPYSWPDQKYPEGTTFSPAL